MDQQLAKSMASWGGPLMWIAMILLAVCGAVPRRTFVGHTLLQTIQYVGHGLMLLVVVMSPRLQTACESSPGRLLQVIGRYSYSIYLWHMGVLVWTRTFIAYIAEDASSDANLKLLVYILAVIPIGILMAHIVEMPLLAIRDRWFPSRSDPARVPG